MNSTASFIRLGPSPEAAVTVVVLLALFYWWWTSIKAAKARKAGVAVLTMQVTPQTRAAIEDLVMKSGCEDVTECLQRSLAVYDALVDAGALGGRIFVECDDGETREIDIAYPTTT